jgi:hypothetical protein
VGHVFQGRYRAILCDKRTYLLELVRYLHLNPVRAGLVQHPADWPWSSHRACLGLKKGPDWLYRADVLSQFGKMGAPGLAAFLSQARDLGPHPEYYRPESFPVLGGSGGPDSVPLEQETRGGEAKAIQGGG